MPEAEILCFDADGVRPYTYEETDSYRITKMFLDDRKRILHHLLGSIECHESRRFAVKQEEDISLGNDIKITKFC